MPKLPSGRSTYDGRNTIVSNGGCQAGPVPIPVESGATR